MTDTSKRPVSPVNGQPLPEGHKWETSEEAREAGKKGGVISGRVRAEKRDLRKALELLLEQTYTDKKGVTRTGAQALTEKLFAEAMKGNVRAFETIRSTVGQDPVQKVEQVNIDMEYEQSVEYVKRLMEKKDDE
jgi:hypothetical protein